MFDELKRKAEEMLVQTIGGLVLAIISAVFIFIALIYLSLALYLGFIQILSPALAALTVGIILLLVPVLTFLILKLIRNKKQQYNAPATPSDYSDAFSSLQTPKNGSPVESLVCSLIAGFIYSNSKETRPDMVQLVLDLSKQIDRNSANTKR